MDADAPAGPETADAPAVIVHSGSTNAPGFEIRVHESGKTECRRRPHRSSRRDLARTPGRRVGAVPAALSSRFFQHLREAVPLSQYEDRGCVKSASFGYSLRVEYRGERSPDLACPVTDPRLAVLVADIGDIERAVGRMPPA